MGLAMSREAGQHDGSITTGDDTPSRRRRGAMIVSVRPPGRFILPAPLREALGIEPGTSMEFLWDGPDLVMRRTGTECALCNARPVPGGATVHARWVCPACVADAKRTQAGGRDECRRS